MAIRVDVKEYCAECCDFEPDVIKPEKVNMYSCFTDCSVASIQSDTVIRCKYAKRCEAIKRYLSQQKGEKT